VSPGNHQSVPAPPRVDVHEGKRALILIDELRR